MGVARCMRCDATGPVVVGGYCAQDVQGTGAITGCCWEIVEEARLAVEAAATRLMHEQRHGRSTEEQQARLTEALAKLDDTKRARPSSIEAAASKACRVYLDATAPNIDAPLRRTREKALQRAMNDLYEYLNPQAARTA